MEQNENYEMSRPKCEQAVVKSISAQYITLYTKLTSFPFESCNDLYIRM
jgi:hypothetical protein